jgi:hypothetical protein
MYVGIKNLMTMLCMIPKFIEVTDIPAAFALKSVPELGAPLGKAEGIVFGRELIAPVPLRTSPPTKLDDPSCDMLDCPRKGGETSPFFGASAGILDKFSVMLSNENS